MFMQKLALVCWHVKKWCNHLSVNKYYTAVLPLTSRRERRSNNTGLSLLTLAPPGFRPSLPMLRTADQTCIVRLGDNPPTFIDATQGDKLAKFVNHSCSPNMYRHTVSGSRCRLLRCLRLLMAELTGYISMLRSIDWRLASPAREVKPFCECLLLMRGFDWKAVNVAPSRSSPKLGGDKGRRSVLGLLDCRWCY